MSSKGLAFFSDKMDKMEKVLKGTRDIKPQHLRVKVKVEGGQGRLASTFSGSEQKQQQSDTDNEKLEIENLLKMSGSLKVELVPG